MTSVIKFFKKKIRPFKACVDRRSNSFDRNDPNQSSNYEKHQKVTRKTSNSKKFRLNLRNKKMISYNQNDIAKPYSDLTSNTNTNETNNQISNEMNQKPASTDSLGFISPVSSNISSSLYDYSSMSKARSATSSNDEFLNSSVSGIIYGISCSQFESNDYLSKTTVDLSTPTNSNSSMVTYNTKYANNSNYSDDDGLVGTGRNSQMSYLSDYRQQMTPNIANILTVKKNIINNNTFRKSNSINFELVDIELEHNEPKLNLNELTMDNLTKEEKKIKKKCRRSNTTFTIAGSKANSKIIDYFNRLEMTKPKEKMAHIRKLNESKTPLTTLAKLKKTNEMMNITIESLDVKCNSEVEKIQDVLFYDEPSMNSTNPNATTNISLSNSNNGILSCLESPPSSIKSDDEHTKLEEKNDQKKLNSFLSFQSNNFSMSSSPMANNIEHRKHLNLNETHLINSSMEKVRRSISMPGLNDNSTCAIANVSKLSTIKPNDSAEDAMSTFSSSKQSSKNHSDNEDATSVNMMNEASTLIGSGDVEIESLNGESNFIRGEPSTRLSKNIKQMFKSVIKYQMNALNSLEKFYESQVSRLETDRERNLTLNPENKEKINEYFDNQLKLLEDRMHSNLKLVCENKSDKQSQISTQLLNNHKQKQLTRKLSQLILYKQLEQSKLLNDQTASRRSRLLELKTNILNQNEVLPSKNGMNTKVNDFVCSKNDFMTRETLFKRNLSLPFQQCKQNALKVEQNMKARSPRLASLAYSTSRSKYNRQQQQQHAGLSSSSTSTSLVSQASTSPNSFLSNEQNNILRSIGKSQYQKNSAKKCSSSNENLTRLYAISNEKLSDSTLKLAASNKNLLNAMNNKQMMSLFNNKNDTTVENSFNSSFFTQNNQTWFEETFDYELNNLLRCNNHLPRFSDAHILYKTHHNQTSKFIKNNNDLKRFQQKYMETTDRNNISSSTSSTSLSSINYLFDANQENKMSFMIETQV